MCLSAAGPHHHHQALCDAFAKTHPSFTSQQCYLAASAVTAHTQLDEESSADWNRIDWTLELQYCTVQNQYETLNMLHRYPLVCLSIIISVSISQRPLVSRVPGNAIEPEGRWVWGRLLGGFVYNAKTSFGGGGGSAAGHTRCGAEVMCGILVSGGGAVSFAGNRGRAGLQASFRSV